MTASNLVRLLTVSCVALALSTTRATAADEASKEKFFEKHIRPLLIEKCYECHSAETEASGGLLLDSRSGWQSGGDSGPAIVPGKPDESSLLRAVAYSDPELQMPPDGPLSPEAVELLRKWIADGAFDPREPAGPVVKQSSGLPLERAQEHWAYRPVTDPLVPIATEEGTLAADDAAHPEAVAAARAAADDPRGAIDAFIDQQLQDAGLSRASRASKRELWRRLNFDLLGLPPTPESLQAFEEDDAPDAYLRAVDRLLASPRFGERFARHWMDVARYAESLTLRGFVLPEAWRYRDYLIDAFRQDKPYDELVREQIAGDLLQHTSRAQHEQQLVATTFLALGNTNLEEQDKAQLDMDYIDEQLDVLGRVFMAQTLGCARCHDHKFDPIPTRDYYALAGIFKASKAMDHANVSKWVEKPLPLEPEREAEFEAAEAEKKQLVSEESQIQKHLGQKPSPQSKQGIDPAKLPGIVIDDQAAKKVGVWTESSTVGPFVGSAYLYANRGKAANTITFEPERLPPGTYTVRLSYTPYPNRSQKTTVQVFSADGDTSVEVNQRIDPPVEGLWVELGKFRFEKDGQAFVLVTTEGADGAVVADAVQFLPEETRDAPPGKANVASSTAGKSDGAKSAASSGANQADPVEKLKARLAEIKERRKAIEAMLATRPRYMTIDEKLPAADIPIHVRGSVHNLGVTAPRGFLQCADFAERQPLPAETSGRRELAEWLSDKRHPLTARVYVNRLWLWTFGAGLVRTVDNFGTTGEAPTHPELLDFLASDLMRHDWSGQFVVRRMLQSATYQQAVDANERSLELDPDNRLWGRSQRRRLDVESLRDAMLAISGELTIPSSGWTLREGTKDDYRYQHMPALRSVYQPVLRNSLPELYTAFDFPDSSVSTGQRSRSVVSQQALAMLNSPWVHARAESAAESFLAEWDSQFGEDANDWNAMVDELFLRCIGRAPTDSERYATQTLIEELERKQGDRRQIVTRLIHALFASVDFRYLE